MKLSRPHIAIDGVFFQMSNLGISRVWKHLLQEWVQTDFAQHLVVLDRDRTAPRIQGITYCDIEPYDWENKAGDSFRLQAVCDRWQIDLFLSTYYTQPLSTPSILLVHDMIPEAIGADLSTPMWQEKHYAICNAVRYITVSHHTARDLCHFYPQISSSEITTTHNGIDSSFVPRPRSKIQGWRQKYGIHSPYFLIVGDRVGIDGYKNVSHFFRAMNELPDHPRLEILCVGGQPELEPELVELAANLRVRRLSLDDRELQIAYSGAVALVYLSIYEGFGLPVLEALACGCPVITCNNSSRSEVAGDAAIYVSETDVSELVAALQKVQQPTTRDRLIQQGLTRAQQFSWREMADTIATTAIDTYTHSQQGNLPPIDPLWLPFRTLESSHSDRLEELRQLRTALSNSQERIHWMETSKFWRLRQGWFKLKQAISRLTKLIAQTTS